MATKKTLIIGAGNFGTALGHHLSKKGIDTTILCRSQQLADSINSKNINFKYLPGVKLDPNLKAVANLNSHSKDCFEFIVIATPTQHLREAISPVKGYFSEKTIVTCAAKGIEINSLKLPLTIVLDEVSKISKNNITALSGPSFAIEVINNEPTAVAVASYAEKSALAVQDLFHTDEFRVYTSKDPIGLEISGAIKNVVALASGAAHGMGLAKNSQAALLTRGLAEITRLGIALGAQPLTFSGLGGVGDLFLTCTSTQSRNFRVGYQFGQGKKLEEIIGTLGSVAEGVSTTKSAYQLSRKLGVETPIIDTVHAVIYEKLPIEQAVANLIGRKMKAE